MRKATAIIGANFGDEGKGAMTDFICHRALLADQHPIVIRYNGGAQAGHTVCADGKRHVFHHFGSGTLAGVPTYLSSFFIVNPLLWLTEQRELARLGVGGNLFADPSASVTTHYDMLINQEIERSRGLDCHGSCGIGINETRRRDETSHGLVTARLSDPKWLLEKLKLIRSEYLPWRMNQLGITSPSPEFCGLIDSQELTEAFLNASAAFSHTVERMHYGMLAMLDSYDHVIFEGAQGLLLDENHRFFPYVTPSKTGLPHVVAICKRIKLHMLNVIYVTRSYATRHGPGPFPGEDKSLSFEDNTNVPNPWQHTLRFGKLDYKLMEETIAADRVQNEDDVMLKPCLAVNHLDQYGDGEMARELGKSIDLPVRYTAAGPDRTDIREHLTK